MLFFVRSVANHGSNTCWRLHSWTGESTFGTLSTIFLCFKTIHISTRQIINLEINVKNDSDQPVSEFSVQLVKVPNCLSRFYLFNLYFHLTFIPFFFNFFQQITYHTHANSSRQKQEIISIIDQDTRGCDVSQEEIIRVNLEIPPIPPTDFSTSNIVKVKYSIRVSFLKSAAFPLEILQSI